MQREEHTRKKGSLSEAKAERTWYLRTSQEVSVAEAGSGRNRTVGSIYVGSYRLVFFFFSPQIPKTLDFQVVTLAALLRVDHKRPRVKAERNSVFQVSLDRGSHQGQQWHGRKCLVILSLAVMEYIFYTD